MLHKFSKKRQTLDVGSISERILDFDGRLSFNRPGEIRPSETVPAVFQVPSRMSEEVPPAASASLSFAGTDFVEPGRPRGDIILQAVVVPNGSHRKGLDLLHECQPRGKIAAVFVLTQGGVRLEKCVKQRLYHASGADDPRCNPVDARVKEV